MSPDEQRFQEILRAASLSTPDFFFIQIGSNDGVTRDPLYPFVVNHRWSGIVVEPVKYLFARLQRNYQNYDVSCINAAIAEEDGKQYFYRLSTKLIESHPEAPIWWEQIGSFSRQHVLKHRDKIPDLEQYLVEEEVDCISLHTLFTRHNVAKIDLLHIDAEGYDFTIIKSLDFTVKPKMILYEYKHLSSNEYAECHRILTRQGYKISRVDEEDEICILHQED